MNDNEFKYNSVAENADDDPQTKDESYGGALYFTCDNMKLMCELSMLRNEFLNNTSSRSGGAIKWEDLEPVNIEHSSNKFRNNKAEIYGDDIASFP